MLHLHDPAPEEPVSGEPPRPQAVSPHGLLGRCLDAWTRLCLRAPLVIIVAAVLSAVAAGVWTSQLLGY